MDITRGNTTEIHDGNQTSVWGWNESFVHGNTLSKVDYTATSIVYGASASMVGGSLSSIVGLNKNTCIFGLLKTDLTFAPWQYYFNLPAGSQVEILGGQDVTIKGASTHLHKTSTLSFSNSGHVLMCPVSGLAVLPEVIQLSCAATGIIITPAGITIACGPSVLTIGPDGFTFAGPSVKIPAAAHQLV